MELFKVKKSAEPTELKKAGGRRQMAGGGQLEEDSNLDQLHFSLKGEACNGLGGREGENLLPPAPCPLPSKAEALVKIPKAQRLLKNSSSNVLTLFVLATLGFQGLIFLQTTFNTIWIAKVARRPAPTLVELVDGRSIQVGAESSLHRSGQAIQYFVSQIATMLFSASGRLESAPVAPKRDLLPKLDPGVELTGNSFRGKKKVTTAAWSASFALSEEFRSTFLPKLAEITPAGTFSGTTQTVLVINHLSKPEPIEAGKWKLRMIANLYTFTGGDRLGKAVPVNKDIYVRATYVTPQPLPERATEIQRAVYNARASGLEIYRFGDLAAASGSSTNK